MTYNLGYNQEKVKDYISSMKTLHHQRTHELFQMELANCKQTWCPRFYNYYESHILNDIENIAAYCVASLTDFFDEYSGITTNSIEGLNYLYKTLQTSKDVPLDQLVISFYKLSIYYDNEIKSGFSNTGEYRLKIEYSRSKVQWLDVKLRPTYSLEEISKMVANVAPEPYVIFILYYTIN
jgi:hypothetical protein